MKFRIFHSIIMINWFIIILNVDNFNLDWTQSKDIRNKSIMSIAESSSDYINSLIFFNWKSCVLVK